MDLQQLMRDDFTKAIQSKKEERFSNVEM